MFQIYQQAGHVWRVYRLVTYDMYCTVQSVVTMEAEAGMTIHGHRWGQFKSAHCAKLHSVWKVCVFIDGAWQLLVTAHVSLLRQPGAVCLYYTAWWSVSSSAGLTEWPTTCLPTQQGHNRLGATVTGKVHMAYRCLLYDHSYSLRPQALLFLIVREHLQLNEVPWDWWWKQTTYLNVLGRS